MRKRSSIHSILQPIDALAAVKAPTYREIAYGAIKNAILNGQIEAGQPLIEERLASMLQISRTPIREALAILEHEGLVAVVYRKGMFVCRLSREEFIDIFVANETVEPYLARRAAVFATAEHRSAMEEAIQRGISCAATQDIPGFLRSGRDFHRLIGTAAGNEYLARFVERNEEHVDLYLLTYGKAPDSAGMNASNREHQAIYKAIANRDLDGAAGHIIYHAQSIRERLATLFSNARDAARVEEAEYD